MYTRFETPDGTGIFHAEWKLYRLALRRMSRKSRRDYELLQHLLWSHTPEPPRWAYGDGPQWTPRTWFKPEARHQLRLAWNLCVLVNRHGARIRPRTSHDPGRILWEDHVQVVVRPHDDLKWRPATKPEFACGAVCGAWRGGRATVRRASRRVVAGDGAIGADVWAAIVAERQARSGGNRGRC